METCKYVGYSKKAEQTALLIHLQGMNSAIDSHEPIHQNVTMALRPGFAPTTPGTFLIPVAYHEKMFQRMSELGTGSVAVYLRILLRQYKMNLFQRDFSRSERVKTHYQAAGQGLVKVGVRPSNTDWLILSEISLGLGFSRCYVFVLLLELDLGLKGDCERVPTPRLTRDNRIIKYAIAITQIIYPTGNQYRKKLRIYELSRLRNPLVRLAPQYFNKDGSFKWRPLPSSD